MPNDLVSVFSHIFNEKLYGSRKSYYFSIATHFVVTEYAYIIFDKGLVFIFAYMALVKYRPIFKMASIVNLYRQMLTGVGLQAHAHSMKYVETMIKLI